MAIYCPDHNLVFIQVANTGSTAITEVLKDKFGGEGLPPKPVVRNGKLVVRPKHNAFKTISRFNLLDDKVLSQIISFGTIRNPFDTLVSKYKKMTGVRRKEHLATIEKKLRNEPGNVYLKDWQQRLRSNEELANLNFADWIAEYLPRNKRPFWLLDGVKHFIRYENLEKEFNDFLISQKIIENSEYYSLQQVNKTPEKGSGYRDYYTDELVSIVKEHYKSDLERFGYDF